SGFWTSASVDRFLTVLGAGSGRGSIGGALIACTIEAGVGAGGCDARVIHGTTLELVAAPEASNVFEGWSGCTSVSTTTLTGDTCAAVLTSDRTVTAAFTALGSVADRVWSDLDGDGVQDAGEPGLDGVGVELAGPAGALRAVTAGGGLYRFPDLYPGSYTVTVDESTLPPGVFPTFDLDGVATPGAATFSITDGQNRADVDFGYQPRLDLVITKDDDVDPLPGGDTLTYTISVSNLGPALATDVVVTDRLAAGTSLIATSGCAEDPRAVPTCTLGDLSIGEVATVTVEVAIDPMPPASITNTASVAAFEFDVLGANNADSETTTLDAAPPKIVQVDADATTPDGELT
ncbi:MAG: SdrD B-like domain-containing protein, partial [Acidobacteriota bacterium]